MLPYSFFLNELFDEWLHGLACLAPACAPEGYEAAIVGGVEERQGVQVLRLSDRVEESVCVRAVRGRGKEGERACLTGGE